MLINLPKQIIFIRHGEKNDHNDDGNLNKIANSDIVNLMRGLNPRPPA